MMRIDRILFAGAIAVCSLLPGCVTVDFEHPRTPSHALDRSQESHLARQLASLQSAHPGKSGFFLLDDGIDALSARLLLSARAEQTIDAQYYFLLDDITSHVFLAGLLAAADRGVRVRLLLDDIQTKGYDRGMHALASHPNFEIRIFNPFARRKGRGIDFLIDFKRANRRMHNKSFTVDGVVTVVGGRNIGAEYFSARDDVNFTDLDIMGVGGVARDVGTAFDDFWNSDFAFPVAAIVEPPAASDAGLAAFRERAAAAVEDFKRTRYAEALRRTLLEQIHMNPSELEWADWLVVHDAPEKARRDGSGKKDALTEPLAAAIADAHSELFLTSPYFVPLDRGVEVFRRLRDRGIDVVIWTNSLAATDVPAVHAGYAPYRKDLLEMGVQLYEARPDTRVAGAERGGMGSSSASLHAKWFTIDRARLFVGSFNWDPRSVHINTEMGILVESPDLARQLVDATLANFDRDSYRVYLSEKGRIRWTSEDAGRLVVFEREPGTSFRQRFTAGLLRLLPIRGQL